MTRSALAVAFAATFFAVPLAARAQLPPPPPPSAPRASSASPSTSAPTWGDLPPPPPPSSSSESSAPSPAPRYRATAPAYASRSPARREASVAPERDRDDAPPPARTGFQVGLRSGYSFALGRVSAASGGQMSNLFSGQVPVLVEAGAKITPRVFLGAYLGFAFGGGSGAFHRTYCVDSDASCVSSTFRLGVMAHYHFRPAARFDPFLGYGIGFEWIGVTASRGGSDVTQGYSGIELAHFDVGVDARLSRVLSVGPVVDLGVGRYGSYRRSDNGTASDGDVSSGAFHEWLTIGARVAFLP